MLLWCRVNASGFVMLRAWYHLFFFLKDFPPALWLKKKVVMKSTHICGFSPVCTTCCACCMPCFCLSSWEFGLLHHWPLSLFFVCCGRSEGLSSWRLTDFIFFLLRCNRPACGTVAVSLPLCFWLLTVSFHWRLHVGSVFVFSYPLMHLAWAVSLYVP